MADDTLKRLLIKLGISTSDFKVAVNEIKKQLDTVNAKAKSDAAAMKVTQQEQLNLTKQQIADQQRLTAEAKSMAAVDQAKATWEKKNQEALQTKIKQRILETAEIKKQQVQSENIFKLEQERIKLQQRQFQLSVQQTKETERQIRLQTSGSATGGGGIFGGIGKFASGLAGGGLLGSIVGGSFLGGGLLELMNTLGEKVHELGRALMEASGPAQTLRQEFERLAAERGVDPTKMLTKMRTATRGLVADVELFKMANGLLKSNMKITSEQMMQLISNTVDLGRSMGKTGPQVAAALERAFLNPQRGMMQLARVTGISVEVMRQAMRGLPATIDPATRATIMFNHVLAEEEKMLRKVGVPATTLPEIFQQLSNMEKNFIDDMATGVLESGKFGTTINELSKSLLGLQPRLEIIAKTVGSNVADAFKQLYSDLEVVFDFFSRLNNEVLLSSKSWGVLVIKLTEYYNNLIAIADNPTAPKKIVQAIKDNAALASIQIKQLEEDTKKAVGASYAYMKDKGLLAPKKVPDANAPDGMKPTGEGPRLGDEKEPNTALTKKILQERMQLEMLYAKMSLENTKQKIAIETSLLKEQYDSGLIALQEYIEREKTLKQEDLAATIKELNAERDAKLKELKEQGTFTDDSGKKISVSDPTEQGQRAALINEQFNLKIKSAQIKTFSEVAALDRQYLGDRLSAYRSYVDAINKVNLQGVQERTSILETEFKQGNVGAQAYIDERKTLIQEELTLTLQGLETRKEAAKTNAAELAKIAIDETNARIKADKDLTSIDLQQNNIRLQALEAHYEKAKKFLEVEQQIAKATPTGNAPERELTVAKALYSITSQYIEQQEVLLAQTDKSSKDWMDIRDHIASATEEELKLNEQMAQLKDISGPLGSFFGSMAGLLGEFKNTSGIVELLNKMESSMEKISKFSIQVSKAGGPGGYFKDLGSSIASIFHRGGGGSAAAKTAQEIFDESLSKSSDTMSIMDRQTLSTAKALEELELRAQELFRGIHSGTANVPLQSAQNQPFNVMGGVPTFQFGGTVGETGLIHAHQGEEIITVGQVSLLNQFINSVIKFGNTIENVANKLSGIPFSGKGTSTTSMVATPTLQVPDLVNTDVAPSLWSNKNSFTKGLNPQTGVFTGQSANMFGSSDSSGAMSSFITAIKSAVDSIQQLGQSSITAANNLGTIKPGDPTPGGGTASSNDDDEDSGGGGGGGMSSMMGKMQGLIGGIQGLVQGLTAGKNASSGALSGGMAGMQFGANFGPIGAAVGLVGGAALGAVFGNKEAHLTADLKMIQTQMQSIIDSMNAGTISLSQTIADLRKERQQAIATLSGGKVGGKASKSKKGQPSQIQQAIAAIDQEIAQLVNEQTQILQNLTSSLIQLSQPIQFQQYLQSLNQIIQQYQQFASAAVGNTQEVANANQFLNLSLQNYVTTLSQNLNQAQQQAIQDALTLINLEYQRQQLMNQTAQQEYDILTQGVLTRQRTTAMTKGQQIGQIEYQRDMQLEQMNEEIALNQAKVDAETKIFGLANTRIGLENQLLEAQKEQADYQIAQVLALSQVVQDLTSGLSSGQIMTQLEGMMQGGSMPTGSGLLMLLAQLLGLGGNVPPGELGGQYGTQNWLEQIPQQWQSAAQYVAGQNANFYTDFEDAAGSPPGSPQRAAAESDVQPLIAQGKVEGYDMQGFYNWLESGTIPTLQSLETGGQVMQTGPIFAHEGEQVIPKGVFATFVSSLNGFSTMMTGLVSNLTNLKLPMVSTTPVQSTLGISDTNTSNNLLSVHSTLLTMTQQRSNLEMQVVSARSNQIAMEMQYLSMLNDTLSNLNGLGASSGYDNLEALFAKTYENRGRYGSGNFRRVAP